MAAYLLLPTESGITLADVEAWAARARTLGASAVSPVRVGASPLAAGREDGVTLSVPVTVTRRILPATDAPYRAEAEAEADAEAEAEAEDEDEDEDEDDDEDEDEDDHDRNSEREVDSVSVAENKGQTDVEESPAAERDRTQGVPRPPLPVFSHPS